MGDARWPRVRVGARSRARVVVVVGGSPNFGHFYSLTAPNRERKLKSNDILR